MKHKQHFDLDFCWWISRTGRGGISIHTNFSHFPLIYCLVWNSTHLWAPSRLRLCFGASAPDRRLLLNTVYESWCLLVLEKRCVCATCCQLVQLGVFDLSVMSPAVILIVRWFCICVPASTLIKPGCSSYAAPPCRHCYIKAIVMLHFQGPHCSRQPRTNNKGKSAENSHAHDCMQILVLRLHRFISMLFFRSVKDRATHRSLQLA